MAERGEQLSVSRLSHVFRVSMPSVVEIVKKLEAKGLVRRVPWQTIELTSKGWNQAENYIHNHRIIEVFYRNTLGLDTGASCEEASRIDYLVSNETVARMCAFLNRPTVCLHGHSITHRDERA